MSTVANVENQSTKPAATRYVTPRVNILETPAGYTLEAELPGVNKDGLEVSLENNELTIIGRRADAKAPGESVYRESSPYDFRRVFVLDPVIDAGKIEAKVEQGVLTLRLPKVEKAKPRKIEVA